MNDTEKLEVLASKASDTIISEVLNIKREHTPNKIDAALARIKDHSNMLAGILKQNLNVIDDRRR